MFFDEVPTLNAICALIGAIGFLLNSITSLLSLLQSRRNSRQLSAAHLENTGRLTELHACMDGLRDEVREVAAGQK